MFENISKQFTFWRVVVVGTILFFGWAYLNRSDRPDDVDYEEASEIAHEAIVNYAQEWAAMMDAAADAIDDDDINTDEDFVRFFEENRGEALTRAFADFNKAANALPRDPETAELDEKSAAYVRSLRDGYNEVQ